ncbi:MAG TPA: ribosome recycling factor [Patescibacteria group bacterium]|nr:ribosome recycling factor [Patescibacteria group bacterium]
MIALDSYRDNFKKAAEHFKNEISALRTGRATPALVEDVPVEAYGTRQPLKAVASISVQDAKTIVVEPWDKSLTQTVEAGLRQSNLGINPVNDGRVIRLPLPELTQERRQDLIKVLHQKLEAARVAIRQIREDARKEIDGREKNKEISEDEKFSQQDQLEKLVKEANDNVKNIADEKEEEITKV